jgi:hypothetical protein
MFPHNLSFWLKTFWIEQPSQSDPETLKNKPPACEMAMVEVSHAVVDPWTMVIHLEHTALTLPTMVCPGGLQPITAAKHRGGKFIVEKFKRFRKKLNFFT